MLGPLAERIDIAEGGGLGRWDRVDLYAGGGEYKIRAGACYDGGPQAQPRRGERSVGHGAAGSESADAAASRDKSDQNNQREKHFFHCAEPVGFICRLS